ncbi:hypothetical protein Xen7305DRAFT_00054080 [Xenococcus sp. PCC 7305]|uniref:hypothetical protein n=1 Tax=Xenococcus sp. PCC 7305 TaxID=102125 RepID=UPI0002ABFAB1|nr:hypothetical protein [Xenococcus sp. PCC 7305]ELS05658.1 hypothetical protein Xen7305DRAFT_00054080 [Xenococcus sp. PCC 7305]
MTSSKRWMCDGVPKNGRTYPGRGEPHGPYENDSDSPYCGDCGLPRESSFPPSAETPSSTTSSPDLTKSVSKSNISKPKPSLPIRTTIIVTIAGILAIAGGTAVYTIVNRCQPGLEKIEGTCIDPFLQPYQEAVAQSDEVISTSDDYKNIEELETAKLTLDNSLEQLNEIPPEAVIYPEVAKKLEEYERERQEIINKIGVEKAAQEKLEEVETIAEVATEQTETAKTAKSTSQLTAAKQKWQEVQNKLQEIDKTRLVTNQIKQHQSDYDDQINLIEEEISRIEEIKRIEQEKERIRKTYKPPMVETPMTKKPMPRGNYPTKPKTTSHDPCAVKNKPPNCLF